MGDMGMEVSEANANDVSIVALNGRLDAASAKSVLAGIKELVKRNRFNIILDMSGVEFIDSAGVGILLASYRAVDAKGGALKICAIQNQVKSIFSLTRLSKFFEIFSDRASAEKDFD
jgi:anti-sigma B factor antagonist